MLKILATVALSAFLVANAPAATSSDKSAQKPKDRGSDTKYCITFDPSTGSRISKTECRSRSEWAQLGINIDDLPR
jgi:hypothetical protein